MTKNIEQEYKTMLRKDEFERLIDQLGFEPRSALIQSNYYYDTPDHQLAKINAALRLRVFKDRSEWTIKQLISELRSIEITQEQGPVDSISSAINPTWFTDADLIKFIHNHQIPIEQLQLHYQMSTHRYLYPVPGATFCLDHSFFPQTEDYELECELEDLDQANVWFDFLDQYQLEYKPAAKKLSRAAHYQDLDRNK
ncbi:CYTH domain-containing protein [Ignavigranum ruoffiae]|uniref:CYTH domain-containing protein n=1 Tax=Ignavigranum ruoffiae TaxID=89093 RepID=UPI0023551F64|nr:CYTH domain-containing protein [Ignavigranum ruoffiae]